MQFFVSDVQHNFVACDLDARCDQKREARDASKKECLHDVACERRMHACLVYLYGVVCKVYNKGEGMLRMCMQQGQKRELLCNKYAVQTGVGDTTDDCDGHIWRYDWHGVVVLADEKHRIVESRGCGESNKADVDALHGRARRRTQRRCAKAERKHWQLQRAGERRSKALRVWGVEEFDDDGVY